MRRYTDYSSAWGAEPVTLKLPLIKAVIAEVPFALWGLIAIAAAFGLSALLSGGLPETANPEAEALAGQVTALNAEIRDLRAAVDFRELEIDRLKQIQMYSASFRVPAGRATMIYDIALAEGVNPGLAFNLVRVESGFRRTAVSSMGAIGYTQIKPSTARWLDPSVTTKDLFEAETNLHLGFRYFNYLLAEYNGDTRLALLAYNRGPNRVGSLLTLGIDPSNGYAKAVMGE